MQVLLIGYAWKTRNIVTRKDTRRLALPPVRHDVVTPGGPPGGPPGGDAERDALTWPGGVPVVAHPPCRAWSSLRHFARPLPGERDLAPWAVEQIRAWGGVLEHPARSVLWQACDLPAPGQGEDPFGGFTLPVDQFWLGHRARKRTFLYVVGLSPRDLPPFPIVLGEAPCTVGLWSGRDKARCRPEIGKQERERTPPDFATWLVDLARRTRLASAST